MMIPQVPKDLKKDVRVIQIARKETKHSILIAKSSLVNDKVEGSSSAMSNKD